MNETYTEREREIKHIDQNKFSKWSDVLRHEI